METRPRVVTVQLSVDVPLLKEQWDYCLNEADNAHKGEPKRKIYNGLVDLLKAIIDECEEEEEI